MISFQEVFEYVVYAIMGGVVGVIVTGSINLMVMTLIGGVLFNPIPDVAFVLGGCVTGMFFGIMEKLTDQDDIQ